MKDKALNKIKKLLRLSKSDNPHEAALALERAKEVMEKYNLTEQDIVLSQVKEAVAKNTTSQQPPNYLHSLAKLISGLFTCQLYYGYKFEGRNLKATVNFVGIEPNQEVACYAFDVLARKLTAARKDYIARLDKRAKNKSKTARADAYCIGWVYGIGEKVLPLIPKQELPPAVVEYMDTKELKEGKARGQNPKGQRANLAAIEGMIAAKSETIFPGAGFNQRQQLQA